MPTADADPFIAIIDGGGSQVPGWPEYQNRPCWITAEAWGRGYIKAFELARIAAWKSARSVAAITVNEPGEIEGCTQAAMSITEPWRGRSATELATDTDWAEWQQAANKAIGWTGGQGSPSSGLLSLKGVGYPMATAILDILDPAVWPVIDKWAATTVFGTAPSRYCAARYAAYARHLAAEGARCWGAGLSIHELDMKAQSASMNHNFPAGWQTTESPPCLGNIETSARKRTTVQLTTKDECGAQRPCFMIEWSRSPQVRDTYRSRSRPDTARDPPFWPTSRRVAATIREVQIRTICMPVPPSHTAA